MIFPQLPMKTTMEYAWSRPNAGSAWDESVAAADQTEGGDVGLVCSSNNPRTADRQMDGQMERWMDRQTDRQNDRQTDIQIDRQRDGQVDRQIDLAWQIGGFNCHPRIAMVANMDCHWSEMTKLSICLLGGLVYWE